MWGFLAALAEFGGGILLILGLLFRPACGALAFTMTVAAIMLFKTQGTIGEASYPIEMGIVFVALLFIGPGATAWIKLTRMSGQNLLPILLAVAVLIAAGAYLAWRLERQRRQAIEKEAGRLGLSFSPDRNPELARKYESLRGLHNGSNRYAFDVIRGRHREQPITMFDFHHETHSTDSKGHSQTDHHYQHVVLLNLERTFPNLLIAPEGIFSKIAQAVGYDDIDFESHEFSRRFCVRSPDRRFRL